MDRYYHSVTLDKDKCVGCTNCLKRCPTEAIRVRGGRAHIIDERCIDCGECIRVCEHHAKIANTNPLSAINGFPYKIALPAPSLYGQFKNLRSISDVIEGLKMMGFDAVYEVARGADIVSVAVMERMKEPDCPRPLISSSCPAVVRLIQTRFPELIDNIVDVRSPREVAASQARSEFAREKGVDPKDVGCFFITPCAAKMTAIRKPLGHEKSVPDFNVYTEVLQDSVVGMMLEGRVKDASSCSLTVSNECLKQIYDNMDYFKQHLTLRQSEISNSPEVIRRLGVIAINTAIEVDIYGNANSTHICGTKMMNGIGGSGDFERNAYISIFTCPSTAKGGLISSVVPFVSHQDSSEHDVNVIVTEQGVADLRGKCPEERAHLIIENCAHPDYRPLLRDYLKLAKAGHTRHCLTAAFAMHDTLGRKGDMHLTDFSEYVK